MTTIFDSAFSDYRTNATRGEGVLAIGSALQLAKDIESKFGAMPKAVYDMIAALGKPLLDFKASAGEFNIATDEKEAIRFALDGGYINQLRTERQNCNARMNDKLQAAVKATNAIKLFLQKINSNNVLQQMIANNLITKEEVYAMENAVSQTAAVLPEFILQTEIGGIADRELALMATLIRKLEEEYVQKGGNDLWALRNMLGAIMPKQSGILSGSEQPSLFGSGPTVGIQPILVGGGAPLNVQPPATNIFADPNVTAGATNIFGTPNTVGTPNTNIFADPNVTAGATNIFGQVTNTPNIFGQTPEVTPTTNIFGQPSGQTNGVNPFGLQPIVTTVAPNANGQTASIFGGQVDTTGVYLATKSGLL